MGTAATDQTKRKALRKRLETEGVPTEEIVRQVEELKARQLERRAEALPEQVEISMATAEMCTSEVSAVVLAARQYWRTQSGGNRERLEHALASFDGVL